MSTKILIVDDEKDLLELLSINLGREGYSIRTATTSAEACSLISTDRPDMILLDIMLPDMSGVKLTKRLKNDPDTAVIPIILLTAKDSETDVVVGLSIGADDYITKPFSTAVLVARIEAVLRRVYPEQRVSQDVITAGPVRIVPASRQVFVQDRQIELTAGQYNIVLALVQACGAILSRDRLKEIIGHGPGGSTRSVDVHVAALRKKLGASRRLIRTVHGQGYRLDVRTQGISSD